MITYKFENSKKLFSFISYCEEIKNFPIKEMKLYTVDGENMNYNIEFNDWELKESKLRTLYHNSIKDKFDRTRLDIFNGLQRGIIFDWWLMIPTDVKNASFDLFDEYNEFYFHIYDDENVINISTHYNEKSKRSGIGPVKRLDNYLAQLYTDWKESQYLQ